MTVSPTHSAWQAVATLAALTYTPIGQAESLGDRLTAILSSELPYRQGAILLGQGAPLRVAGSWGLTDADLESLRRHPPVRSGNGLPAPTQEGWQGIELQALGETIGVLALRGLDDTALPEDLLLALAGQVALLCFAGYVAEHEPEATQQVDPVQVAATLAGPLYELAGQTDFRRFLRELALQAAKLPDVVGAAVYLASEERMSLAASASEDNATFPGELQQSETEILNSPESGPHPAYVLLSLQDGKQRIGTLLLYHTGSTAISQRTRQAYDLFAVQASLALRTARTFENQRTQGRDLFILYENSRILNSTLDLGIILDRLCENVAFALASDHCIVMLWDQERGEMEYASAFDAINPLQLGSFPVGERFKPAPDSVAGLVMRTGRPIAIDNLSSDPRIGDDRQRLLSFGFKSVLCAPMIQQDNLLGILLVSSNNPRSYSSVEMTLIQTLAGQAAIALGYARVIEEERQRSTEMELLHTLSRELSSGLSVQEAAEAIVRVLERIKPGADFEICVYDSSAQLLRTVVRSASAVDIGSTTGVYTLDEGFSGWLARHRRPLRIDDISGQRSVRPANAEALKKRRIRSFLGVPLLVGDELVGTIELASPKTNAFGPDDELLLMIIAGQAAQAIQNAISFETADEVLRKRIRELTALQRISRKLTSTLYLDDILAAVLAEAQEATAAPAGMVILRDEVAKFAEDLVGSKFAGPAESRSLQMDETGTLRLVAVEGYSDEEQRLLLASLRDPNGPFSLAIAEGKAQIVDDLSEEIASLQLSMQSLLLVPVIYEERIAGIIILGRNSTRAFNRDALEFVRALADQAALAIGNAQHFAELERQRELLQRRASLLNEVLEIGNALRADRELPDLLEQVAFSVADAAGFRSVVFILTDRERPGHMRVVAAAGVPIAKLNRMRSIRITIAALHPFLDQRYRLGRAFFIPEEEAPQDSEIDEILDWQAQTSDTMPGGWQPGDRFLVPLYSTEREMIGLMAIDDPFDRRRPNRRTAEILEIFANQAAIAIENAWLFRDRERQIRGLEAIRRIGQVTSSTLDMDSLLQGVYEVLTDFLPVDSFILHVVDTERKLITRSLIIDLGEVLTVMQEKPVPPKSLTEWLLTNHQPLLFGDINQEISAYPDITPNTIGSGDNAPSWMGVPLLARDDQPIGVMAIQNYRPHAFSQRDLDFMLSVAHQVSLGLQNVRLFAETEGHLRQIAEEAERLTTINRVSSLAASTLDFRALCQLAVDEMARATEADQSRLLQFDRSQNIAICRAEYHHTGMVDTLTLPLDTNPTIAWLDREQRPLRVENVATDPVVAPIKETLLALGIRSMMIVPLVVKGEVIGSVGLDRLNEDRPFSERDAETCQTIANQISTAMENSRLFRERERRIRELDAINRISQAVTSTLDLQSVLERLHHGLGEIIDVSTSFIGLYDAKTNILTYPLCFDNGKPIHFTPAEVGEHNINGWVIRNRQPLLAGTAEEAIQYRGGVLPLDTRIGREDQIEQSYLIVPIIAGDEVLGVINIQSYERYAYSQQDLNFVSTVAGQAAAAIANARLFRERERRIRELDAINRISRAVTSTLDLQSVLERLHHGLGEIIDVSTSFIGLYDARTNILSYPICYDSGQPVHFDPIPLRGGITRWGIINRQPVLVDSAEEAASYEQDAQIARVGIEGKVEQSFLVVPIIAGDEVLGVINIQSYERNAFTHHDLNFVSTVAGQAAAAIANARLFSERDRSIQELSTLNKIGQALGSTVRFEDLLQVIYEQTSLLLDTTNFYMALYDERRYQVSYPFFYEHGQPISIPSHRLGKGLTDYVISTRQPLLITERFEEFLHEHNIQLIDEPARSWLGVPMIAADKVVGVIGIQDYEHEHAYGENEVRLLSTIANQAAQALENARLFTESRESVRELSTLSETSVSLAGTLEIEEILTIGASSAMELARSDVGGIFLIEENEGSLELGEAIFLDQLRMEILPDEVRLKLLRTLDRLDPLREGQPVRVADAQDDPSLIGLARKLKVRGLAILPILKEQRLGGAMLIGAIQPREFEERAIASLNILGAQVGQAIENAQLFAQIRRFNSELEEMVAQRTQALAEANAMLTIEKERIEALHTIATELSATLELNEVLLRTLDLASKALNVNHGSIVLHDAENDKFICRAVLGRNGRAEAADYEVPLEKGRGLASWIINHPEAEGAIIHDTLEDERWVPLPGRSEGARAVIAVPLMSSDTVVGVLMFTSSQPGSFTSDHLRFLRTIGTEVSAALHNAELYKLVLDSADRLSAALMQQKEEAGKREAILRSVSEGVMVLDQSGTIILYNPAAERVLQVPADQVIGQTLQIFARYQGDSESEGGADRALLIYTGLQEGLRAVDSNDQVYSSTISLGGQTINASFAPVTSADGSRLGVVVVLRDITREIEADRAKRDFISMVSHELRTPLTPIRGYVDLMLLGAVGEITDTQRDCLNAIKKNMLRMLSLVEDLLEIGRIEAGKIKLDITLLDIASSINEIVGMLKPMIDSKEMNLTIEIPPDLPQIEADSKRIGQVLTNMISNAIKYTFARGNIWVRAFTRDDDFVQIEVQDTGVGIKPEDMKKLFTRFFRTDNPLRDEAGGTGLGLSIAKSFVEMHGGEMWVESELNVGSTFKVALPIRQPRPELDAPQDP